MVDEQIEDNTANGSIESASAAIDALLKAQPADDAPQAPTPAPQNSPQVAAPVAPDTANTAPQDAPAASDAVPTVAPAITPQAKPAAVSSEIEQARQDAARERQAAETARNEYVQRLTSVVTQSEREFLERFPEIKTKADLFDLGDPASPKYDVSRYNSASIALQRIDNNRQTHQQEARKLQDEYAAKVAEWRRAEQVKIDEMLPELKDPEKGPVLSRKLAAYAKEAGYTDAQLSNASAIDYRMVFDAMSFRELKASQAKALEVAKEKAATAPPVQQPGVTSTRTSKEQNMDSDFARLKKSGRTDDAAEVFRHLLN